ncbi:MAG: hypothetical protein QG635_1111, partial [Bacteroidota bacterium]|nr:hypothetical protein [Bacteroidota bacterium]
MNDNKQTFSQKNIALIKKNYINFDFSKLKNGFLIKTMITMKEQNKEIIKDSLILILLWIIIAVIINPIGEFPLNDDWLYSKAVIDLLHGYKYQPSYLIQMTLISQSYWGLLFCLPSGFSFTALRISTLTAGIAAVVSMYFICRKLELNRTISFIFALIIAFNPIFLNLSYTYMTDIPFFTMTLISFLFFFDSIKRGKNISYILGIVFSIFSILCRQIGIMLPIAFGLYFIIREGFNKKNIIKASMPFVFACSAFAAIMAYLIMNNNRMDFSLSHINNMKDIITNPLILAKKIILGIIYFGFYLGLFSLPALPLFFNKIREKFFKQKYYFLLLALSTVGLTGFLIVSRSLMPVLTNIVNKSGIGPLLLRDTLILRLPNYTELPLWFWLIVTILSVISGAFVLTSLLLLFISYFKKLRFEKKSSDIAAASISIFFIIIYFPLVFLSLFFDRYLLLMLPFLLFFLSAALNMKSFKPGRINTAISVVFLILFAFFGIAGTRDYLRVNEVKWHTADILLKSYKIKPEIIEGG